MDAEAAREHVDGQPNGGNAELAQLSNAMVRLYKDLFGRGPTQARTSYAGPDLIVTTLRNSLSRADRHMAEAGDHERLRDLRIYFQYQHQGAFVGAVEEITGRHVEAFISGIDTEKDVSAELFYLEPRR